MIDANQLLLDIVGHLWAMIVPFKPVFIVLITLALAIGFIRIGYYVLTDLPDRRSSSNRTTTPRRTRRRKDWTESLPTPWPRPQAHQRARTQIHRPPETPASSPRKPQQQSPPPTIPSAPANERYYAKASLNTPTELRYYRQLQQSLKPGEVLFTQVSLIEIVEVVDQANQADRNRIDRKRVDFVICDAHTLRPLRVIEIDDRSHLRQKRRERDNFVDAALADAGIPIEHIVIR